MSDFQIPFRALLAYRDAETNRWREWFAANPGALIVEVGEGRIASVHGLVTHIFVAELRYAQRVLDERVSGFDEWKPASIDESFAIGDAARAKVDAYLASADTDALRRPLVYKTMTAGEFQVSPAQLLVNLVMHGSRHWAQIATAVRRAGGPKQWPHDFLVAGIAV
jgi:uncharacterized damage-inducible protein DinB